MDGIAGQATQTRLFEDPNVVPYSPPTVPPTATPTPGAGNARAERRANAISGG